MVLAPARLQSPTTHNQPLLTTEEWREVGVSDVVGAAARTVGGRQRSSARVGEAQVLRVRLLQARNEAPYGITNSGLRLQVDITSNLDAQLKAGLEARSQTARGL